MKEKSVNSFIWIYIHNIVIFMVNKIKSFFFFRFNLLCIIYLMGIKWHGKTIMNQFGLKKKQENFSKQLLCCNFIFNRFSSIHSNVSFLRQFCSINIDVSFLSRRIYMMKSFELIFYWKPFITFSVFVFFSLLLSSSL